MSNQLPKRLRFAKVGAATDVLPEVLVIDNGIEYVPRGLTDVLRMRAKMPQSKGGIERLVRHLDHQPFARESHSRPGVADAASEPGRKRRAPRQ